HSKTPGHPEYGYTPGIETTTGPLGQGFANAVGMALAERTLAATYNRPGHAIIDHHTYVSVGDGCLMEGISHEAASLAGTLGLGKLITLFDSNRISIDGDVDGWFRDDSAARFEAYGWHVIRDVDGHDPDQIIHALNAARAETDRPSFIVCHTEIGHGAPNKAGTAASHGAPLGAGEVAEARNSLGWDYPPFEIPAEIYAAWDGRAAGQQLEAEWNQRWSAYAGEFPEPAAELERRLAGILPAGWPAQLDTLIDEVAGAAQDVATRKASQIALDAIGPLLPELIGGSADLTGSNLTLHKNSQPIAAATPEGNYLYYGVREFGMTAINNGMALHGGFIPYGGTFLMFSEYARNALRMAALMKVRNISVFTHDSIGLGEDGPTHQAVEQAATLRLLPNMSVWRPCDTVETLAAWRCAVERRAGPTSLLLSRQGLPHMDRTAEQIRDIARGAYVLLEPDRQCQLILIATGSELALAMHTARKLNKEGAAIRVVSMPSCDVFDAQDPAYRDEVLPGGCDKRIAVEAGVSDYWRKYVGLNGAVLGIDTFGESAPAGDVFKHFGFTQENLLRMIESMLAA
ncbi:MAG: transketolase, partial [Thiotrichales bacterium]|nr:transketolase [Thiotrichales bacterium]